MNTEAQHPEGGHQEHGHEVHIKINGVEHRIHRGRNSVEHLRHLGQILEHEVLSEEREGELVDLPEDGHVEIKGGEVFVSHERHHHKKEIEVTVEYVGNKDFAADFPPSESIEEVKLRALDHFHIERTSAAKYALQYKGVDQSGKEPLSKLHHHAIRLTLVLLVEPNKG